MHPVGRVRRKCANPGRMFSRRRLLKGGKLEIVAASQLRRGDLVVAEAGDLIPGDGEIVEGIATIDESVVTGESAPVIRESTGDLRAVTAGSQGSFRQADDLHRLRAPHETFLDRTHCGGGSSSRTENGG